MSRSPYQKLVDAFSAAEDGEELLNAVKNWMKTEWRPGQRMFEGIALAMLRERPDEEILFEIHRARQYSRFVRMDYVTYSRFVVDPDRPMFGFGGSDGPV